jgi:hypothetical protein
MSVKKIRELVVFESCASWTNRLYRISLNVGNYLREDPREYRPTYTYIGCGKIVDFEFDQTISKLIKSDYENPNMNSF